MTEDYPEDEMENAKIAVRSSKTREEILRQLKTRDIESRPSEIIDQIIQATGTSEGNVYESFRKLQQKDIIEKREGDGRATLYSLTDLGEQTYQELGFEENFGENTLELENNFVENRRIKAEEFLEAAESVGQLLEQGHNSLAQNLIDIKYSADDPEYEVLEDFIEVYEDIL